jgi:hypothetical protein
MDNFCKLIWSALVGLFRSRASLQAENLVLRHQLNVLRRKSPRRITSSAIDRLLFVGLYALAPSVLDALQIVKPDTVIRWHRAGVPIENSNSAILMMQSAKNRDGSNAAVRLNCT